MTRTISYVMAILFALGAANVTAAPFGGAEDEAYAKYVWNALVRANMVGPNSIMSTPYTGAHPHGAILDTIDGKLKVKGLSNVVIVKRNYGGEGVSKSNVANNPSKYLKAITVMYKRKGYDADNQDWFWVKYKPDGKLHTNPKGMKLAGRVAKGKPQGCIACHTAAPGGDMIFNYDR